MLELGEIQKTVNASDVSMRGERVFTHKTEKEKARLNQGENNFGIVRIYKMCRSLVKGIKL